MKILEMLKKRINKGKKSDFSNFVRNASEEEKIRVFREVAHRSNEDQRAVFEGSGAKTRAN